MIIPKAFADLMMECPESARCYSDSPELMIGHLTRFHEWDEEAAEASVKNWMDSFEQDEHGRPLRSCPEHGLYPAGYGECPGCAALESETRSKR